MDRLSRDVKHSSKLMVVFTFKVSIRKSLTYPQPETMPRQFPKARGFR